MDGAACYVIPLEGRWDTGLEEVDILWFPVLHGTMFGVWPTIWRVDFGSWF